ncbi:MAG TPA: acyl-CoA dehydrogenase family protein [Acidimicrobiales bacterium]
MTTVKDDVPTVEELTASARSFLAANASPAETPAAEHDGPAAWGEGSDSVALLEETDADKERAALAEAQAWAALRYDAGFGWIDGPTAYGGRGLSGDHAVAYRQVEREYLVPDQSFFTIGLGMVAPTVLAHATEPVKQTMLPRLYRGDLVACQLFSEPGAGSDLASVATRAERDGDEWTITGQKVWTSGAQNSDVGEILCRTDPTQPKHQGMTAFMVDMHAPGVEVRPLRQITGGASFNEVFFTGVRVPDSHRLGDVNGGWRVAITTLMNERAAIGGGMGLGPGPGRFERLVALVRHLGLDRDPLVRQDLSRLYIHHRTTALTTQRGLERMRVAGFPGPELSTLKLAGVQYLMDLADFVSRVLGPRLTADTGEWGTYAWGQLVCGVPGGRLGGGSDEVLRNIVGERVLGLPKDPGIDPTTPFKDLARSV